MPLKENGFTLLEMLLVLTVFIVCFGAALIPLLKAMNNAEEQHFFQQLERDLFYAHSYAMVNNTSVAVSFYHQNENKYAIYTYENPPETLAERDMPAHFQLVDRGLFSIMFRKEGSTNRIGTVYFETGEKQIKLVFLLGRGRFYFDGE